MNNTHLSLIDISKTFLCGDSVTTVFNNIDICFKQEQTYGIVGMSGAGKSALMHIIAGIDTPSSGTVMCNNKDFADFSAQEFSYYLNTSIGLVFQSPYLLKELSVIENVMLPGYIAHNKTQLYKDAASLLEKVGLAEKMMSMPRELSGGQQQRVALARALINKPLFLIADEPTGNLDDATGKAIVDLMLDCQKEWRMGMIVSSHDQYVIEKMNEIYELVGGKLIKKR